MKRDIILFISKSGAGKDFYVSKCSEKLGYKKAISYTSRPARPNEVEGIDYYFRNRQEIQTMIDNDEVYEYTEYKTNQGTWLYAFGIDSFSDEHINMAIVNPHGYMELLNTELSDRLAIVYIEAQDSVRFNRYNSRLGGIEKMTIEQKAEGYDRIKRDNDDFLFFEQFLDNRCPTPYVKINNSSDLYTEWNMEVIEEFVRGVSDEQN